MTKVIQLFPEHTETKEKFPIGSVFSLIQPCIGNPIGALCVVYDIYARVKDSPEGDTGYSLIFVNGRYDGFSDSGMFRYFIYRGYAHSWRIRHYPFSNVINLERDFDDGLFDDALVLEGFV